ncbi:hypothetical protein CcaverHIS002_0501890 [Cutaneotrichosporon cavernicola]|nr:hypothetical protein CcaverHIS002_0501890 [Cutaneotrichosporon cavernicola]BEJ00395.1 hypothetical protein CcaverHIS631_0502520 [Cutaneotrichosporon cavernicola]BEJ08165.1 hypothetical protein CcaverHIS641_0502500 [Cutaneotrichosporon cavernicola]
MTITPVTYNQEHEAASTSSSSAERKAAAARYPAMDLVPVTESQPWGSYPWGAQGKRPKHKTKPALKKATSLPAQSVAANATAIASEPVAANATATASEPAATPTPPRGVSFNKVVHYLVIERLPEWASTAKDGEQEGDQGTMFLRPVGYSAYEPSHIDVARSPEFAERQRAASDRRAYIHRLQHLQDRKQLEDGDYRGCDEARSNRSVNKWTLSAQGNEVRHSLRYCGASYDPDSEPPALQEPDEDSGWETSSDASDLVGVRPANGARFGDVSNHDVGDVDNDTGFGTDTIAGDAANGRYEEVERPPRFGTFNLLPTRSGPINLPRSRWSSMDLRELASPKPNDADVSADSVYSFNSDVAEFDFASDSERESRRDSDSDGEWDGDRGALLRSDNDAVDDGWVDDGQIKGMVDNLLDIGFGDSAGDRRSNSPPSRPASVDQGVSNDSAVVAESNVDMEAGDTAAEEAFARVSSEFGASISETSAGELGQAVSAVVVAISPSSELPVALTTSNLQIPFAAPGHFAGPTPDLVSPASSYPPTPSPLSTAASRCPSPLLPPSPMLFAPPPSRDEVAEPPFHSQHPALQ